MSTTTTFTRANPSPRYRELISQHEQLHLYGDQRRNIPPEQFFTGHSLARYAEAIKQLADQFGAMSILDYGSGKGAQYVMAMNLKDGQRFSSIAEYWDLDSLTCYDPGYEVFAEPPTGKFDGVISTEVLQHVPEEDMPWVVDELFTLAQKFLFVNASSFAADYLLPNGENAHSTIQPVKWWRDLIQGSATRHPQVRYFVTIDFGEEGAQRFIG